MKKPPKPMGGARPGAGRPPRIPNGAIKSARDTIIEACEVLGGAARLADWALESAANETCFWSVIYPRLLALEAGNGGSALISGVLGVKIVRYSDELDEKVINGSATRELASPAQQLGSPPLPKA